MTEQKYTAKQGFQTAIAKFMGLSEEPMTGTKSDGNPYRKAKVRFHLDGREKENKFIMWTPIKTEKSKYKSDEELKQFQKYRIIWTEENKEYNGREWVEKQIVIIKNHDDPEDAPVQNKVEFKDGTAIIAQDVLSKINGLENWDKFIEQYKTVVPDNIKSANHIVGTYLGTYYKEFFKVLYDKAKEVKQ